VLLPLAELEEVVVPEELEIVHVPEVELKLVEPDDPAA
jgi:hypothetical protein